MKTLFQLSAEYQRLMDEILTHDEISDELMLSIENVNEPLDNKILNYASMIKELETKSKNIESAIEEMQKRVKSLSNGADRLRESVRREMEMCDKRKIENEFHKVLVINNNPRVAYSNKDEVPKQYWRYQFKEVNEPNTAEILKLLKEGVEIQGAYLVRDTRLAIR